MNIMNLFKKKHALDKYPVSSRGYPIKKWGSVYKEYIGGKWVHAIFEPATNHYNNELMNKVKGY